MAMTYRDRGRLRKAILKVKTMQRVLKSQLTILQEMSIESGDLCLRDPTETRKLAKKWVANGRYH